MFIISRKTKKLQHTATKNQTGYRIDLHTHSPLSHDGGITEGEYMAALTKETRGKGKLDYIAITDHNEIDFAIIMNRKYGNHFIIGEEIQTGHGEIVGLYLTKKIEPGQGIQKTIDAIREQGGIVYIPHPFDIRRSGISKENLIKYIDQIDIIEIYNSRVITPFWEKQVTTFNSEHNKPAAAGSDSHSASELGKTFTLTTEEPNKTNLVNLLKSSEYKAKRVSIWGFTSPKRNKLKKLLLTE